MLEYIYIVFLARLSEKMVRKKIETITSLGDEDKLTVQKSLPLFSLWRSELTLAEFKILDIYLSRIDSRKPEKRVVTFEKGELENILGVKKINNLDLKERLKHLMGNVVEISDKTVKKGFKLITLFECADAEQDENGTWQVKLEATQRAMKYIFNIENLGYLRYKLRCITTISSRYTYIMFIYLEANRFRKSWSIELNELKKILNCDKEETYKEYKHFNNLLLKKAQSELSKKTECRYAYEPIKKGRSVVAIRFTVETLPKTIIEESEDNQMTIEEWVSQKDTPTWYSALLVDGSCEFSKAQLEEIHQFLITVPMSKMSPNAAIYGNMDLCRYHYIAQKYAILNTRDDKKPIRDRFAYFIKMLKKDAEFEE